MVIGLEFYSCFFPILEVDCPVAIVTNRMRLKMDKIRDTNYRYAESFGDIPLFEASTGVRSVCLGGRPKHTYLNHGIITYLNH